MVFYHQMVGMPYPNVAILAWDVSQSQALLMLRPACRALAAAAKARFRAWKKIHSKFEVAPGPELQEKCKIQVMIHLYS